MTDTDFEKVIEILDKEIKLAFDTRAHAESQQAISYWSGYYSGLKRALELLLKAKRL